MCFIRRFILGVFKDVPIGLVKGKWTLIQEVDSRKGTGGRTIRRGKIQCECGYSKDVRLQDYYRYPEDSSCPSCKPIIVTKNYSGVVIGKLTVKDPIRVKNAGIKWKCSCTCGREVLLTKKQIDGKLRINCGVCSSKFGKVSVGDKQTNKDGFTITLLEMQTPTKFLVIGEGCKIPIIVNSTTFKNKTFVSPYKITVGGVGYYGEGIYIAKLNGKHTPEYRDWSCMLKRCYCTLDSKRSYFDVDVCSEWYNFQNFATWCTKQPNFNKEGWRLDKDLLGSLNGDKLYSPDTCVYLPVEINNFIKTRRMNNLPLGVDTVERNGTIKYRSQGREDGKTIRFGLYDTISEAFLQYKNHKELHAKILAEKYKEDLPLKAYKALLNYEVKETF
jgi:hypothetical protein